MNPLIQSRLIRHMADRKTSQNIIKRGFTLVELMVVIVIVGILSSIALPNFLNQSAKAKGAEANSMISVIMKNAQADYHSEGSLTASANCTEWGAPEATTVDDVTSSSTKFYYVCAVTDNTLAVTATGNTTDGSIGGKTINKTLDLQTGLITLNEANTSKLFGGNA